VDPGQLSGHPEPGLIEVRDVSRDQRLGDGIDRRRDDPGDLRRHRGDRARGRRAAEHLAQRGGRPAPGQELAMPQVGGHGRGPRPVLHRRPHPIRRLRPGPRPAARALPLDHLVLGDLRLHRRDLRHLPPLHPGLPCSAQARPAAAAAARLVPGHVIGMAGQLHRRARLPLRPAGPAARAPPQRLRGRLAQPVRRRRPGGVLRVLLDTGGQVSHLPPQLLHLFPQLPGIGRLQPKLRDQLIAFCQQLPQPRVRGPQPGCCLSQSGRLTGHGGRIGHMSHSTTAGPPSSTRHVEPMTGIERPGSVPAGPGTCGTLGGRACRRARG